jgi:hypothetical protein
MLTRFTPSNYLQRPLLVFALAVLGCLNLRAEAPFEELKSKLDQAIEESADEIDSDQRVATTGELYLERLDELKAEFIDRGSLDGVLAVQDEIERFEDQGGIPDELSSIGELAQYQRIYANEIKKIESEEREGVLRFHQAYDDALLKREEELVRMGFIDKAVEVRDERLRVKKVIRKLSRGEVDPTAKQYFASYREQEARRAGLAEDVFKWSGQSDDLPADSPQPGREEEGALSNQAFEALEAEFKQALQDHWDAVASGEAQMYQEYMKELSVREFHYQNQGSLDGVLAARAEKKRLRESGALLYRTTELKHLAMVRKNFARDLKELKSKDRERLLSIYRDYLNDLGELERSLVKKELIDEAVVVRKERKRAAEKIRAQAEKELVLSLFEVSQGES